MKPPPFPTSKPTAPSCRHSSAPAVKLVGISTPKGTAQRWQPTMGAHRIAVDMMDKASALPTYPQRQQQKQPAFTIGLKASTRLHDEGKKIVIGNCVFENCRGFARESVDGAPIEDITFTNIVMRNICNAPFFLRLGARLRAPPGIGVGTFRRVMISHVIYDAPTNNAPAIIAGIPGHLIENVYVSDVVMVQKGGGAADLIDIVPPELEFHHVEIPSIQHDARRFIWVDDVDGADFSHLNLSPLDHVPAIRLRDARGLRVSGCRKIPDTHLNHVPDGRIP